MQSKLTWSLKTFEELTTQELYLILQARINVFVVEQTCPYEDCDNKDQHSLHLFATNTKQELAAYARLVPPKISYANYASIGRVLTTKNFRGQAIGKQLMERAIEHALGLFPNIPIKISAQQYLLNFYQNLGFEAVGEGYLEDDIPHIAMIYQKS